MPKKSVLIHHEESFQELIISKGKDIFYLNQFNHCCDILFERYKKVVTGSEYYIFIYLLRLHRFIEQYFKYFSYHLPLSVRSKAAGKKNHIRNIEHFDQVSILVDCLSMTLLVIYNDGVKSIGLLKIFYNYLDCLEECLKNKIYNQEQHKDISDTYQSMFKLMQAYIVPKNSINDKVFASNRG